MRKFLIWLAAIVIGVPVIAFGALALMIYWGDPGPPAIFSAIHCDQNDWQHNACSVAFDKTVQQEFHTGTPVGKLKMILSEQRFKPEDDGITRCTHPGDPTPNGVPVFACPSWDQNWYPKNRLVYHWGKPPCGKTVSVMWSSDKTGKISHIEGEYYLACL